MYTGNWLCLSDGIEIKEKKENQETAKAKSWAYMTRWQVSCESEGCVTSSQPVNTTAAQVAPPGSFTSRLRCASLKGLYKPEDAFNENGWVWHMQNTQMHRRNQTIISEQSNERYLSDKLITSSHTVITITFSLTCWMRTDSVTYCYYFSSNSILTWDSTLE